MKTAEPAKSSIRSRAPTRDVVSGSTTYSLKPGVGDAAAFTINGSTGAVTLTGDPNFEAKSSYAFTVVATDAAGNFDEQAVTLAINNRDEVPPTITSSGTAPAINENSGANQVVYTVTSTDTDVVSGSTTYSLKPGVGDAAAFTINGANGQVTADWRPEFRGEIELRVHRGRHRRGRQLRRAGGHSGDQQPG